MNANCVAKYTHFILCQNIGKNTVKQMKNCQSIIKISILNKGDINDIALH